MYLPIFQVCLHWERERVKWVYSVLQTELPWTYILLIDIRGPCMDQDFSSKDFMVFLIFACSLHYNDTNKSLLEFFAVLV